MVTTPVKVNNGGATRERSKNTVNRDIASLKAALNCRYCIGETCLVVFHSADVAPYLTVTLGSQYVALSEMCI